MLQRPTVRLCEEESDLGQVNYWWTSLRNYIVQSCMERPVPSLGCGCNALSLLPWIYTVFYSSEWEISRARVHQLIMTEQTEKWESGRARYWSCNIQVQKRGRTKVPVLQETQKNVLGMEQLVLVWSVWGKIVLLWLRNDTRGTDGVAVASRKETPRNLLVMLRLHWEKRL